MHAVLMPIAVNQSYDFEEDKHTHSSLPPHAAETAKPHPRSSHSERMLARTMDDGTPASPRLAATPRDAAATQDSSNPIGGDASHPAPDVPHELSGPPSLQEASADNPALPTAHTTAPPLGVTIKLEGEGGDALVRPVIIDNHPVPERESNRFESEAAESESADLVSLSGISQVDSQYKDAPISFSDTSEEKGEWSPIIGL